MSIITNNRPVHVRPRLGRQVMGAMGAAGSKGLQRGWGATSGTSSWGEGSLGAFRVPGPHGPDRPPAERPEQAASSTRSRAQATCVRGCGAPEQTLLPPHRHIQDPASQRLTWNTSPKSVLVIKKIRDASLLQPFKELCVYLMEASGPGWGVATPGPPAAPSLRRRWLGSGLEIGNVLAKAACSSGPRASGGLASCPGSGSLISELARSGGPFQESDFLRRCHRASGERNVGEQVRAICRQDSGAVSSRRHKVLRPEISATLCVN